MPELLFLCVCVRRGIPFHACPRTQRPLGGAFCLPSITDCLEFKVVFSLVAHSSSNGAEFNCFGGLEEGAGHNSRFCCSKRLQPALSCFADRASIHQTTDERWFLSANPSSSAATPSAAPALPHPSSSKSITFIRFSSVLLASCKTRSSSRAISLKSSRPGRRS